MNLSRRVLKVLSAIVELFIRSGGPVASREVARFSGLGLSSATIRNIMSELEEAGYLSHARVGRRTRYQGHAKLPLRHPLEDHLEIGALLRVLKQSS